MTPESSRSGPRWAHWALMLVCICGSAWLYRDLVRLTPQMISAEPTEMKEILPWVKPVTQHTIDSIKTRPHGFGYFFRYLWCCAGLFGLYGLMLWLARRAKSGWFVVGTVAAAAVFMGIMLCAPAMFSSDTYAYAWYGRLLGVYGADARGAAPPASLADPFLFHGWYHFVPSVYGPLWTVISAGLTWAGGGRVGLTLLLFRGFEAVATLGSAGIIWVILKKLRPDVAAFGTLLFLWNPLVLIESALCGHNDACMMALALAALWLHLRGWKAGAAIVLALSALVKVATWPLVPLYILMVLRSSRRWSERGWYLARAGAGVVAAVILAIGAARMGPGDLIVRTAASPGFYVNSYLEVVFKGLRLMLGEHANTIEAPMDFRIWWVTTSDPTQLHLGISNKSRDLCQLQPGQPLVALTTRDSRQWLRVFDPAQRMIGFVNWSHLYTIPQPPNAMNDPVVRHLSVSPQDWPTVVAANRWIRVTTWGLFVAFGLLAVWKARDFETFLYWATAFFLVAQLLVLTAIWPWYAVWPLAFGALIPRSGPTLLAIMLSAGMSALYSLLGFADTRLEWPYDYRSLFTIVLPVVLFALMKISMSLAELVAGRRRSAG